MTITIEDLPLELIIIVLEYLDSPTDLVKCALVNKTFNKGVSLTILRELCDDTSIFRSIKRIRLENCGCFDPCASLKGLGESLLSSSIFQNFTVLKQKRACNWLRKYNYLNHCERLTFIQHLIETRGHNLSLDKFLKLHSLFNFQKFDFPQNSLILNVRNLELREWMIKFFNISIMEILEFIHHGDIRIYACNYNVQRIISGSGGLPYP